MNHEKYMAMALDQARGALAIGEFPVGVVFVHQERIVASGHRAHSGADGALVNEIDHAEMLALRTFLDTRPGIPAAEVQVYATMEPCLMCYATMLLNGIRQITYAYEDVMGGGTNLPLSKLSPLYAGMEVTLRPHVLRAESLGLFQKFFSNPDNPYWRDSLLANYTLSQ